MNVWEEAQAQPFPFFNFFVLELFILGNSFWTLGILEGDRSCFFFLKSYIERRT